MREYYFTSAIRLKIIAPSQEDAIERYSELLKTIPPSIKVAEQTDVVIKEIPKEEEE